MTENEGSHNEKKNLAPRYCFSRENNHRRANRWTNMSSIRPLWVKASNFLNVKFDDGVHFTPFMGAVLSTVRTAALMHNFHMCVCICMLQTHSTILGGIRVVLWAAHKSPQFGKLRDVSHTYLRHARAHIISFVLYYYAFKKQHRWTISKIRGDQNDYWKVKISPAVKVTSCLNVPNALKNIWNRKICNGQQSCWLVSMGWNHYTETKNTIDARVGWRTISGIHENKT